jgi:RNA polymerase sigma-70 factor, ECF subfamily
MLPRLRGPASPSATTAEKSTRRKSDCGNRRIRLRKAGPAVLSLQLSAQFCTKQKTSMGNPIIFLKLSPSIELYCAQQKSCADLFCYFYRPKSPMIKISPNDADVAEPCGLSFEELRLLPDETVMAHLRMGHDDALAVLFDRYHRLVFHVALKILRDSGEAEDVMQNVFLEIYKVAGQFDPARGTTKVWVLQYAYHRSMNKRQQLITRKFYDSTDVSDVCDSLATPTYGALPPQESRHLVKQSLEALNSTQRRVLELAYFEGLSLKEIAEQTGESLGNVRHHYYRGLAKLRVLLSQPGQKRVASYRQQEIADARA